MLWRRGKSYSQDLRERVFAEADDGETVGEIATLLRVSVSYVSKVLGRRRLTGETTTRPQRGHQQPKLAPYYDAIRTQVQEEPDATIGELQHWLRQTHHVSASSGLICETLALLGLTRKKRCSMPWSRIVRISPRPAANGVTTSQLWTQPDWSSSTRPGSRPT
jgi:transposase